MSTRFGAHEASGAAAAPLNPALGEAELIAHCRAALAGYETPKDVIFTDSLPETVGGKVLKYKLRVTFASHYENAEAILPG